MKLLLINKNPVVSRMLRLSAPKADFEVEECDNVYNLPNQEFDVVLIDDEMYDENFLKEIKRNIKYYQIGIISSTREEHIEGFDFTLPKPFLPTDLIELLRSLKSKIDFIKKEQEDKDVEIEEQDDNVTDILSLNKIFEEEEKSEENLPEPVEEEQEEEIVQFEESEEEEPFIPEEEVEKSGVLDENELEKVQELLEEEKEEKYPEELAEENEIESEIEEKESIEEKPAILEKLEDYKEKKEVEKQTLSSEEKIKALMGALDLYTIRELLDGMEVTIKINFNKKKKKKR